MASCEPVSCAELQTLLSLQERNQRRWAELGSTFWLRLLVCRRSDILTQCAQYQSHTLDSVHIDLLKMLVGKSYGKIHKYFSDISLLLKSDVSFNNLQYFLKSKSVKEQKCYSEIFKQLFGTQFMKLSPWWLARCFKLHRKMCKMLSEIFTPDQHHEFEFPFPCLWSHCKAPWPFEVFVRSRWGDALLKSLACKKEDILWWTVNKKCEFSPPQECTLNSDQYKVDSSPVPVKFCSWLAPYCHTFIQGSYERENGAMQCFGEDKALWWDVLELSFPPMWSKKFYSGPAAVTDNFTNSGSLDCCVWISMWLNSCGLEFLAVLQECQQEFLAHGPDHVEDGLSWRDRMLEYKNTLESMHSLPDCPAPETTASFLLEPELLVQLPWYHNLLQLWLAAALMEVTRCDIASMELRHWPIPEPLIIQVTEVLSVLSVCKNILLCGLSMLSRDIFNFPKITCGYPGAVMDAVILPVLPLLRFVVDHAIQCLTELKRAAWCRDNPMGVPTKCVPVSAYTLRPEESEFFHHHFFHIRYWMDDKAQLPYSDIRSIKSQFEETTSAPLDNECKDFYLKQLSTEESVCEASLRNFTPKGDPRELVTQICQDVLSEAPTPEGIKSAERHALLAIKMTEFTSGLQREETPSLLRCLVRLTGEALVREQEVRVAAICAQASGHPMALHDLPPDYEHERVLGLRPWVEEFNKLPDHRKRGNIDALLRKIVPDPKILSYPFLTKEEILKVKVSESTNVNFDKNCNIIMLRCFVAKYDAFEDMKQQIMSLDPYTFFYVPAYILTRASRQQTRATSLLLSTYVDEMLATYYKLTIFDEGVLEDMKRYPIGVNHDGPSNNSASAVMSVAPQTIGRDLTPCHALASMCTEDSDSLMEHIKRTVLQYYQNKVPRHKLEVHRLIVWITLWKKICFIQKMICENAFSLKPDEESTQTIQNLCDLGEKVNTLYHQIMLFCETQEMKERGLYKLLAAMHLKFKEYYLRLLRAAIWQKISKDSGVEEGEEYKLSKGFKNEVNHFLTNMCVVILVFKQHEDIKDISKPSSFPVLRYNKVIIDLDILRPDFEESVIKNVNLKIPPCEKRDRIVSKLAKQFLNMTLEVTSSTSEGTRDVVPPETTPAPTEVCHVCNKTAAAGRNLIRFEGELYCSSLCKGSVQEQWCRCCKKRGERFLLCERCGEEGESYPDPNYFCTEQCRERWWTEEHYAEHLEYELGLGRWYVQPAQ